MESQKPQEMELMSEAEFVMLLTAVRPKDRTQVLEAIRAAAAERRVDHRQ